MIQLNNTPFIIRIVQHVHSSLQPGYICEGKRDIIVRSVIKNVIIDRNNNKNRSYKRQKKLKR